MADNILSRSGRAVTLPAAASLTSLLPQVRKVLEAWSGSPTDSVCLSFVEEIDVVLDEIVVVMAVRVIHCPLQEVTDVVPLALESGHRGVILARDGVTPSLCADECHSVGVLLLLCYCLRSKWVRAST